jgi:polyisoprenoid-binding protein YceI
MASKAGHDLVIEVTDWSATLTVGDSEMSLTATADAGSLEVREGLGGVKPLTDGDRNEIKGNINNKVLQTSRHPQITFTSTRVAPAGGAGLSVTGELTIAGSSREVQFPLTVESQNGDVSLNAKLSVDQTEFGIKPYSALMGALKVAPTVEITAQGTVPAG